MSVRPLAAAHGRFVPAVAAAELPAKARGRHRWVAQLVYTLSGAEAAAAAEGDAGGVALDVHRLVHAGVSCIDCGSEPPGSDICPAEAFEARPS